ncbi:hypothetical protein M9H77_02596 [Catharanthus roseus]|uniref:Uncharacterized protein n=1 Tax=Catharanthus roseus TaxID=4058 RepID=A0ACC0C8Z3_CATRO|nr:hypothetical protein M9H77_02596 [Catharanthus roseus]
MKKLKASNGNEDNGMVAYMKEFLKDKIIRGSNLREKIGQVLEKGTLSPTVALPLPSLVGFCWQSLWNSQTYHARLVPPTVAYREACRSDLENDELSRSLQTSNFLRSELRCLVPSLNASLCCGLRRELEVRSEELKQEGAMLLKMLSFEVDTC